MQDDKLEQTVGKDDEDKLEQTVEKNEDDVLVFIDVSDKAENNELGLELVPQDMDSAEDNPEGDEFIECVLDEVFLIDSEDGIDEDIPNGESDKNLSKPSGIFTLLIMFHKYMF